MIGGERFGRYSIVGLPARERLEVAGGDVTSVRDGAVVEQRRARRSARVHRRVPRIASAPRRSRRRCDSRAASPAISATTPCATSSGASARSAKPDPLGLPDIRLLLSEELAVVDNLSGKLHLVVYADPARARRLRARRRRDCRSCARGCASRAELPRTRREAALEAPRSNIGERAFHDAVARCKQLHHRRRHDAGADLAAPHAALSRIRR